MRAVTAVLMAVVLVFAPVSALANEVQEGSSQANNPSLNLIGGVDGTSNRVLKTDSNGILRIVDEYPDNYQTEIQTLASNFRVNNREVTTPYMLGNSVSSHPFGKSVLHIERTGADSLAVAFYLYGSYDDEVFTPVGTSTMWGTTQATGVVDTLQFWMLDGDISLRVPIPADAYPGRYLALWAWADTVAGVSSSVTVKWEGRQD